MIGISTTWRAGLVAALTFLFVGLLATPAGAAEFKYALDPELSLTGNCDTSAWDPIPDPDCEPTYPPPPEGPSGRFDEAIDISVDDWGNQYVVSRSGDGTKGRIDVFDPEGHFITELEDPLGPNSAAVDGEGNLYVYEALRGVLGAPEPAIVRYPPTTYNPAAGEIAYDPDDRTVVVEAPDIDFLFNGLAIDRADPTDPADDRLYVSEGSRIRIYSSAEDGNTLVDTITPAGLSSAKTIAVDAERRLIYVSTCKGADGLSKCVVWVFDADAPYDFVAEIDGSQTPAGKFVSVEGRISIAVDETNGHVFIGDLAARDDISELDEDYNFASTFKMPGGASGREVQSDVAENPENKMAENTGYLYVPLPSPGSAIAFEPPDVRSPIIKSVAAQNIGENEAELEALIHPGQRETTYAIEYVTEAQYEVDGFESATPAGSGSIPGVNSAQRVSALLSGLIPGQSYRFLVTAENELGEAEPKEGSFTTFDDVPVHPVPCANDAFRTGPSAALPDCRAWELVTPPGARGPQGAGFEGQRFGALQASPSGNAMSFEMTAGPLPGTEAAGGFHGDPYLATRLTTGWSTKLVGPTGQQASKPKPGSFSPDQGYSFWTAEGEGTALVVGAPVYYVRYPDGRSELVGRGSLGTDPRAVGRLITEGGTHIIFQTFNNPSPAQKLEPNAPEEGITAVYDRTLDEVTHVVSLLPGDVTPTEDAAYVGASADGEGIAFRIGTTLYLRVGNAVTHEIGTGVTFAGVSEGGERIFYVEGGDLKAFDVASEEEIDFTGSEISAAIPVNVAPQGNRAYFVSETALGGANPNGDTSQPGAQNLYLSEDGAITFVATVTPRDVEGTEVKGTGARGLGLGLYVLSLAERKPAINPSRLTSDGSVFAFQSRANLDGYQPGEDPQIYRYDHLEGRLHCVSCPPTKTAATGGAALQSLGTLEPSPFSAYGFVPALRADGERLFFESTEALVSGDTDGLRDVYEWEEDGVGSCDRPGGCVYLISSGGSAHPDYLFGHSASGDDVFVSTYDVLVGSGEETIRIYDARVGGGFASVPKEPCPDESCRPGPNSPPALPAPKSDVVGPPQITPKPPKKCPKGKRKVKRKGKVVCVKKKSKKQRSGKNKAGANRGTSR